MASDELFLIDLDKIIRDKAGDKAKYFPKFVVSWLKRIIHQDEVNDFLVKNSDKVGVSFLEACLKRLDINLHIEGIENLPKDGRLCTFVSNHPLGGVDGIALGKILGNEYDGKIKYLVNDLLMNFHNLAPLFIPINKIGSQSKQFPMVVEEGFNSDNNIIMFPAGICSRKIDGVIRDLPWKKTFITKSVETHRDVVPIHFSGQNSNFFYNLANVCKALGIKFNIAMLFLSDEMFKSMHKTFDVHIGKPISWETFDKSRTPAQWAQYVQDIVYQL